MTAAARPWPVRLLLPFLLAGLSLAGCTAMLVGDGTTGSGSGAGRPADAEIVSAVRTRLAEDPAVDAARVEVVSIRGRVTLSGRVATYGERDRAGRLAASVRGVAAVDNRLAVGDG